MRHSYPLPYANLVFYYHWGIIIIVVIIILAVINIIIIIIIIVINHMLVYRFTMVLHPKLKNKDIPVYGGHELTLRRDLNLRPSEDNIKAMEVICTSHLCPIQIMFPLG